MKVLIAPMAETSGPFARASSLCRKLMERGHEAALCAAQDVNYRKIENVRNYDAPIPSPLGTPLFIGKRIIKIAQVLKIQEKKKVNSYEQVLHFVGAIDQKFFEKDVRTIRQAIRDFQPDAVYAEFRISAIVAARLEKIKVATGYSYPVQTSFASNPEFSAGVRKFLRENQLPPIESVLDIFNWADLKIVPSSYELEPIDDTNTVFTGPFSAPVVKNAELPKNKIIAYMGYGTITPENVIDALTKAFERAGYQLYVATEQVKPSQKGNMTVDRRYDFGKLMPEAVAYINHGGQNSIMTGLLYGVPQIVCPGTGFERRYNAASLVNLRAGVSLESGDFNAENLRKIVDDFKNNPIYTVNSKTAGERLLSLGGANKAVDVLEKLV